MARFGVYSADSSEKNPNIHSRADFTAVVVATESRTTVVDHRCNSDFHLSVHQQNPSEVRD